MAAACLSLSSFCFFSGGGESDSWPVINEKTIILYERKTFPLQPPFLAPKKPFNLATSINN